MGLPLRLSEMGVDESKLEEMAKRCTGWQPGGMVGQLERLTWEDVYKIYKASM